MKIPQILHTPIKSGLILFAGILFLAGCSKGSNNNPNPGNNQNPAPLITSISPTHAPGAAKDTITGTGFDANNSSVLINGQKATLVSATSTQLIITIPSLAGTGKVTVNSGSNTLTGPLFTYDTVWNASLFADNLDDPRHLALDSSGNIYVTYSNTVAKIAPGGTLTNLLSTGFIKPMGVAADAAGNIFVADDDIYHSAFKIYKYTAPSVRDSFSSCSDFIWSLTMDHPGNLYAITFYNQMLTDVIKFSPRGTATPLASHIGSNSFSTDVTIDAASTMYLTISDMAAASHQQSLYTIGPSGAVGRFAVSGTAVVSDIAWSNGYLYFSSVVDSAVYRANAVGGVSVIAKGLVNPGGMVVDKKGMVYVANFYTGSSSQGKITKYSFQ